MATPTSHPHLKRTHEDARRSHDHGHAPPHKHGRLQPPSPLDIDCDPSRPFPNMRKPSILGDFSLDERRQLKPDRSRCKFYRGHGHGHASSVDFDLNVGLDRVVRKDEDECKREALTRLLNWACLNKRRFLPEGGGAADLTSLSTDFVLFRGALTTLMCTPYERRDAWRVSAVKWRGTVYLHKEETEEQAASRRAQTARQRAMCSWGYRFEQCVLSDTPASRPDAAAPVNENEEFCCVFCTRLGRHTLVYVAEMDGVLTKDDDPPDLAPSDLGDLNNRTFVELKTSRELTSPSQERNFKKFKLIKWWCQSFLVGIPTVVCGFRDDRGRVHTLQDYPVRDIARQCRDFWQPNVCMNFLDDVLDYVKRVMEREEELTAVTFGFWPGEDTVRVTSVSRDSTLVDRLLPEWYRSDIFRKKEEAASPESC